MRSALRELSAALGICDSYLDQTGREERITHDDTRVAILAAMGIDASSEANAGAALAALRRERDAEVISPVCVIGVDDPMRDVVEIRSPEGCSAPARWLLELQRDDGAYSMAEGLTGPGESCRVRIDDPLPTGYHGIRVTLTTPDREWIADQTRIVVPPRACTPQDLLPEPRAFGITVNLYTLASARNWGIGDMTDLEALAEWGAERGAVFVGVNPLHALLKRGNDVSPYSPVSRLYRNPLYIDVERVPELRRAPEIQERLASPELREELAALRESPTVPYGQAMGVKGLVLAALHRVFRSGNGTGSTDSARHAEFREYVEREGTALERFAIWMTIAESHGADWRQWPEPLRDPSHAAVSDHAREHAERVDYHRWIQFELDRQLGEVQLTARVRGMAIGLYQDLAIGSAPGGADAWANPSLFVTGVSVGAPPDPYAAGGQNWGLPPIDPRALRRDRYRYFVQLVRGALRHSGALRIDHVMGLFRLFWIPDGMSGRDGTYVRYPSEDLLGILALESQRHRALVVGEDLGTVPPEVPPALRRWGILSSKVMQFERDESGFLSGRSYEPLALATANTHDMVPLAGYWAGRDIEIRAKVGLIDDGGIEAAQEARLGDRESLLRVLREDGVLPIGVGSSDIDARTLGRGVHAFLARTPSVLVGVSLDDLAGEREPVNVPGVGPDRHPSWTRRMSMPVEELTTRESVAELLAAARRPPESSTVDS